MDYPRGYTVAVSIDGKLWTEDVGKGIGDEPITEIEVDTSEPIQFIRITQTGHSPNKFWSIHELGIKGMSLREPPPVRLAQEFAKIPAAELAKQAREKGDAHRGAKIFFNQALSCVNCHEPKSGDRLGPDLASRREGVNDAYIVDSVLDPSKVIRKEFAQLKVLTADGLAINAFVVSETNDELILKEPAGGKIIKLPQDEVEFMKPSKVSAMPPGLINQLSDKGEFLDLIRFLMEINGGGSKRMAELR